MMAVVSNNSHVEGCHLNCKMEAEEKGQFDVVVMLRLIMASLSIIGALSIISSAVYRKTACNPRVHPIFVLSIVDTLLSVLWISGALVWLKEDGLSRHDDLRVSCFIINCLTVILQCVAMNVTLIYAFLAYSSIKQRDFSGVYMVQQIPVSVHVWPPLCSFTTYFIAWTLPIVLIVVPFGVIAEEYDLVRDANNCSCWCLPFFGNVVPRPQVRGTDFSDGREGDRYLTQLYYFMAYYSAVLITNFTFVLCCMAVVYFKLFRRIRRMIRENNETTHLYGATRAMILEGHKDAKKRVLLFFLVYVITGTMILVLGVSVFVTGLHKKPRKSSRGWMNMGYHLLLLEALFVPSQGFLNALVYGWTRGDFLRVMSSPPRHNRLRPDSLTTSDDETEEEEEVEETGKEDEREDWERGSRPGGSLLFSSSRARHSRRGKRGNTALTPVSP